MTAGGRFVAIPADRLQDSLDEIGELVEKAGGSTRWTHEGREHVWELTLPEAGRGFSRVIRVFTSLAKGGAQLRGCGQDAVRIVVGTVAPKTTPADARMGLGFRPLEKGQKILRTAPRDAEDRVGVFLERLRDQLRKAWTRANAVRTCPDCGKPMALREGRHGAFLGCVGFPQCKRTIRV